MNRASGKFKSIGRATVYDSRRDYVFVAHERALTRNDQLNVAPPFLIVGATVKPSGSSAAVSYLYGRTRQQKPRLGDPLT